MQTLSILLKYLIVNKISKPKYSKIHFTQQAFRKEVNQRKFNNLKSEPQTNKDIFNM